MLSIDNLSISMDELPWQAGTATSACLLIIVLRVNNSIIAYSIQIVSGEDSNTLK